MSSLVGADAVAVRDQETIPISIARFEAKFVGSFFELGQLPGDKRPQIAVAGRSNVGKSSLLNQVLGQRKLAKVSSTPGKTRSLNFFLVNDRFYLVDLPGYGYAKVSKQLRASWSDMIESYLINSPDLIGLVLLLDSRRDPTGEDIELIEWLASRQLPVLAVITKTDKITRDKTNRKVRQVETELGTPALPFSIKSGAGKRELISAIQDLVAEYTNR